MKYSAPQCVTLVLHSITTPTRIGLLSALLILGIPGAAHSQLDPSRSAFWFQEDAGLVSEPSDHAGWALAIGDFNNDGQGDLAIGIPSEDVGALENAGVVAISYGTPGGWDQRPSQWWWQGTAGVAGAGEAGDSFGNSLAVGDFDCDGFDDLAIGSPFEDVGTVDQAGAVVVLYGSPSGLSADDSQIWAQDSAGIPGNPEIQDRFGIGLAAGDFNVDLCDDLAIGTPGDRSAGEIISGSVQILFGGAAGLSSTDNQFWNQDSPGVAGSPGAGDSFGSTLVAGDFDRDLKDDLVIGAPLLGAAPSAGFVGLLWGSFNGLVGTSTVLDPPGNGGLWGNTLAAGDINGDGANELLGGAPKADEIGGPTADFGYAKLFYGSTFFPETSVVLHQGQEGFGAQVVMGNFNGVGGDEIVVQTALPNQNNIVWVDGTAVGNLYDPQPNDGFGDSFAVGDLNDDGVDDLAIGIPRQRIGDSPGSNNAGMVQILFGHGPNIFQDGFEGGDTSAWQ